MLNKVEKQILENDILELHNKIAENNAFKNKAYRELRAAQAEVNKFERIGFELGDALHTKISELEGHYQMKEQAIEESLNQSVVTA